MECLLNLSQEINMLESIFVLLCEIIRECSILFRLFTCYHLNDSLSKYPSEIAHEKGEETGDTISKDDLEIVLTTRDK